ncbi:MAG: NADPH:quinone oxidoreductase family protein [Thermoanaerobaculia bacterium]|nr:MAG: NADPH:quinone oxidoreductase family protein [Thermoanaerobaculia bacterium]
MKAILLAKHGRPGVLRYVDLPEPVPGPDQVLVRVETIGLNFAEVLSRRGQYGWAPPLPYVPGMEAAGEVEAIGTRVRRFRPGDRVIVLAQYGSYAERVAAPEARVVPALARYSAAENAAVAVSYLTAWVSLFEMARLRASDRVLVHAAAGGVGSAAVQLAKAFGCTVYGAVGSERKLEVVRALGADHVTDYRARDLAADLEAHAGARAVDVALALVAGEPYRAALRSLAPFGRVVIAGVAGLQFERWNPFSIWRAWRNLPRPDVRKMAVGSYGVLASHLGYLLDRPERLEAVWRELAAFLDAHGIRPLVGAELPFDRMPEAHALMESRQSTGKIVVRV